MLITTKDMSCAGGGVYVSKYVIVVHIKRHEMSSDAVKCDFRGIPGKPREIK